MALSAHARRQLKYGLASAEAADDVADIVDADTGTQTAYSKRAVMFAMGSRKAANLFETAIEAGDGINAFTQRRLAFALGDAGAAQEIATQLVADA